MYWDVETLSDRLPEDIEKMKWAGDFENAYKRIDYLLSQNIPQRMKKRLCLEKGRIEGIARQYAYSRDQALHFMQQRVPDFTFADLDRLDLEGATDFIYVGGEKRYIRSFRSTLLKVNPEIRRRAGIEDAQGRSLCTQSVYEIAEKGEKKVRLHMKCGLRVKDDVFVKGETYIVHIPIPAPSQQTGDIQLISFSHTPFCIADENAYQRTICFRETLQENADFFVEYAYTQHAKYYHYGDTQRVYDFDAPPTQEDLAEQQPHLTFTPYLRALEKELAGSIPDPLQAAKAFYDYITCNVRYSFVRHYANIDHGAEYAATNLKGDCGLQALMFIALCRLHGIPARWQSGLWAEPDDSGSHDWAQFYIEGPGWLFCDPSYGGGAHRSGDEFRREFYFGNLDPYRMPSNRAYCKPFQPAKQFFRNDPFDSQEGECETLSRGLGDYEYDTWQDAIPEAAI